jgi:uncharacterized damage-inducible protein DinB
MKPQEIVAMQFGLMYQTAAANLDGLTHEQSLEQPPQGGNCANWILGHLTNVQNGVMGLLGEKPVWESDQLARAGFDPITRPTDAIDWTTLRDRFLGSRERCLKAISALSDEALAESLPHPFGGTASRVELLSLLAFHQAYHGGQLALARRVAGLEGAVKGPGQTEGALAGNRQSKADG